MSNDINRAEALELLENTIGIINISILSNELQETPGYEGDRGSFHKIVFQIEEDEPDISAIGILFSLSLMSFTYAAPRGYSENDFIPDEDWQLGYFIHGLEFEGGNLHFSSDYISGRMMKTAIIYEPGGKVTLTAINRGKSADRWMTHLQGKRHLSLVKNDN
ncbi:MAG: hypothetical protein M0P74_13325 [Syntrophales bacterium]|jgi:hypothetical protein|nr:hypothetical protein [Syntrophales bacterium]